jgi:hypothetical protein
MTFPFILQYALDTPDVADKALQLAGGTDPNNGAITNDTKNAIRELVLEDDLSFASAMWFIKRKDGTGCPDQIPGLQAVTFEGWQEYITKCVGTTVTDARAEIYNTTLVVLQDASYH